MYLFQHSSGLVLCVFFFFQAEDGIRYLVRSRGLGDVYKRQVQQGHAWAYRRYLDDAQYCAWEQQARAAGLGVWSCLLYTSDAADERSSVDLGGRRIIKKKTTT